MENQFDFIWLLKNHIDIFGLVEKGLAEYIIE